MITAGLVWKRLKSSLPGFRIFQANFSSNAPLQSLSGAPTGMATVLPALEKATWPLML
ncbi:hypothetical protein D3C87_2183440 [compost metagenome]